MLTYSLLIIITVLSPSAKPYGPKKQAIEAKARTKKIRKERPGKPSSEE